MRIPSQKYKFLTKNGQHFSVKSATSFSGVAIKVYRWLAREWGFASRFKQFGFEREKRWQADTNSILKSTPMLRIMFRNYSKWSIMKIEKRLVLLKSGERLRKLKAIQTHTLDERRETGNIKEFPKITPQTYFNWLIFLSDVLNLFFLVARSLVRADSTEHGSQAKKEETQKLTFNWHHMGNSSINIINGGIKNLSSAQGSDPRSHIRSQQRASSIAKPFANNCFINGL